MPSTPAVSYGELARLFLRLSLLAFGGPVAHIAMMEDEIVARRGWLTRDHYLDLIAATNLIPGPNSTEVAIHIGYSLRGISGALLTGFCFIFPSFVLTLVLAVLYVNSGQLPQVDALLWGIKPVIIGIIAVAGYRLVRAALVNRELWLLFALTLVAIGLLNVPEVLGMLGAGVVYALYRGAFAGPVAGMLALLWLPVAQAVETARPTLIDLFLYFLKIGAVLFGSGYVLVAYTQQDLVDTFGWLTAHQLLDAVAIGQLTPGPVSTMATVVGYILGAFPGAVVATIGIFLPSFVFVILSAPLIPRMRRSRLMSAFLSGVNAGVVAAILITVIALAQAALIAPSGYSPVAIALLLVTLVALIRFRVNATWLILGGAIVGLALGVPQ